MIKPFALGLLAATAATMMVGVAVSKPSAPKAAGPSLAHMVFFTLKDHSPESRSKFVASCQKYLTGHEGVSYFSVGTIAEDVVEGPSVRDFDVALHVVFDGKAARDTYLVHPRHTAFVDENKAYFEKVRVFDTYLAPSKP